MAHSFDFEDSRHAPIPGQELLWAVRVWVIGTCHNRAVEAQIRRVLGTVATPLAAEWFVRFMWVVVLGTQRKLTIACPCKQGAGADEQLLIDVVALCQQTRTLEAMVLLRSLLPPQAALDARDSAEELAHDLAEAGHFLPPPQAADRRHAAFVAADSSMLPAMPTTMH